MDFDFTDNGHNGSSDRSPPDNSKATSATFFLKTWGRSGIDARHSHDLARCKSVDCTPRLAVSGCVHRFRTEAVLTTHGSPAFAHVFARRQHADARTAGCDRSFNWIACPPDFSSYQNNQIYRIPSRTNCDASCAAYLTSDASLARENQRAQNGTQPDSSEPCPNVLSIIGIGGTGHDLEQVHHVSGTVLSLQELFGTRAECPLRCPGTVWDKARFGTQQLWREMVDPLFPFYLWEADPCAYLVQKKF
ncbi:hypothetical protein Bbelb_117200 [Branchiostoma belcheri]|nr:hypothetical protein Bbelb_117200 [Branchiostoma belcheri]